MAAIRSRPRHTTPARRLSRVVVGGSDRPVRLFPAGASTGGPSGYRGLASQGITPAAPGVARRLDGYRSLGAAALHLLVPSGFKDETREFLGTLGS